MTKLSKSVSVAELMHMREKEHLSNQDIAKRLGISTKTVYAYIGKQPSGMRKPWGSNRKKDELPPLSENTEVPEMPRKSFAERCEEALGEPMALHTLKHDHATREEAVKRSKKIETLSAPFDPLKELAKIKPFVTEEEADAQVPTSPVGEYRVRKNYLADDREATEPLTETPAPYTTYKGVEKRTSHIPELIAVFGTDAVRQYLRVALYDNGIPDCRHMTRTDMLSALETLNKTVEQEVKFHD